MEQAAVVVAMLHPVAVGIADRDDAVEGIVFVAGLPRDQRTEHGIRDALHFECQATAGIVGEVRFATQVAHPRKLAFGLRRGAGLPVPEVEAGGGVVVEVEHVGCRASAVEVILRPDAVRPVVGHRDALAFGIDRLPQIRGVIVAVGHDAPIRVVHECEALESVVGERLDVVLAVLDPDELVVQIVGIGRAPCGGRPRRAVVIEFHDLFDGDQPPEAVGMVHVRRVEVGRARQQVLFIEETLLERHDLGGGLATRTTPSLGRKQGAQLPPRWIVEHIRGHDGSIDAIGDGRTARRPEDRKLRHAGRSHLIGEPLRPGPAAEVVAGGGRHDPRAGGAAFLHFRQRLPASVNVGRRDQFARLPADFALPRDHTARNARDQGAQRERPAGIVLIGNASERISRLVGEAQGGQRLRIAGFDDLHQPRKGIVAIVRAVAVEVGGGRHGAEAVIILRTHDEIRGAASHHDRLGDGMRPEGRVPCDPADISDRIAQFRHVPVDVVVGAIGLDEADSVAELTCAACQRAGPHLPEGQTGEGTAVVVVFLSRDECAIFVGHADGRRLTDDPFLQCRAPQGIGGRGEPLVVIAGTVHAVVALHGFVAVIVLIKNAQGVHRRAHRVAVMRRENAVGLVHLSHHLGHERERHAAPRTVENRDRRREPPRGHGHRGRGAVVFQDTVSILIGTIGQRFGRPIQAPDGPRLPCPGIDIGIRSQHAAARFRRRNAGGVAAGIESTVRRTMQDPRIHLLLHELPALQDLFLPAAGLGIFIGPAHRRIGVRILVIVGPVVGTRVEAIACHQ